MGTLANACCCLLAFVLAIASSADDGVLIGSFRFLKNGELYDADYYYYKEKIQTISFPNFTRKCTDKGQEHSIYPEGVPINAFIGNGTYDDFWLSGFFQYTEYVWQFGNYWAVRAKIDAPKEKYNTVIYVGKDSNGTWGLRAADKNEYKAYSCLTYKPTPLVESSAIQGKFMGTFTFSDFIGDYYYYKMKTPFIDRGHEAACLTHGQERAIYPDKTPIETFVGNATYDDFWLRGKCWGKAGWYWKISGHSDWHRTPINTTCNNESYGLVIYLGKNADGKYGLFGAHPREDKGLACMKYCKRTDQECLKTLRKVTPVARSTLPPGYSENLRVQYPNDVQVVIHRNHSVSHSSVHTEETIYIQPNGSVYMTRSQDAVA